MSVFSKRLRTASTDPQQAIRQIVEQLNHIQDCVELRDLQIQKELKKGGRANGVQEGN